MLLMQMAKTQGSTRTLITWIFCPKIIITIIIKCTNLQIFILIVFRLSDREEFKQKKIKVAIFF